MTSGEKIQWLNFFKDIKPAKLSPQETYMAAQIAAQCVLDDVAPKNITKLEDGVEVDSDLLWVNETEIMYIFKKYYGRDEISDSDRLFDDLNTLVTENRKKTYNKILDAVKDKFEDDVLLRIAKNFLPIIILNFKMIALTESLWETYTIRDVEDIKESIEEKIPELIRAQHKFLNTSQQELSRLFELFFDAKSKLHFLNTD